MLAIWTSWKRSVNCGDRVDVVRPPKKAASQERSQVAHENKLLIHSSRNELFRNRYCELNVGDPSRSVIEKIFSTACSPSTTTIPSNQPLKIKRVLRVKNPQETVERFEKYRDMVKKKASAEQPKRHPRSMVDGNELLCFYPTTMTCCKYREMVKKKASAEQPKRHPRSVVDGNELLCFYPTTMTCCTTRKPSKLASTDLCEEYHCRACRIIETRFHIEHYKRNGIIQMNTSTNSTSPICWSESVYSTPRGKKNQDVKKAVIICRMIAGRIMNLVDGEGCGEDESSYDSIRGEGFSPYSEYLMVRNPDAVLPCFLVVL